MKFPIAPELLDEFNHDPNIVRELISTVLHAPGLFVDIHLSRGKVEMGVYETAELIAETIEYIKMTVQFKNGQIVYADGKTVLDDV